MATFFYPDADDEFDEPSPPSLDVEVSAPQVLGHLLGPDGEVMFTLVDRPVIPFGFRR